ncbi:MAG: glutamine-hydrolyzing GMP synthase [Treponema sp.]|nr:glutamine-hydrolyzing GMP synthase [Treponema sp.]
MNREKIVVLDFGSQYAHLIAKRFRMLGYYSEIADPAAPLTAYNQAKGIVLSGGPHSLYETDAPAFNRDVLSLDIPILGLCYGHYIVHCGYNGSVGKAAVGEFGIAQLELHNAVASPLFEGVASPLQVWMSHQDAVLTLGDGFETIGHTADCAYAATQNLSQKRFSLQFHCEVKDTPDGDKIFANFARYCGMPQNWDSSTVIDTILEDITRTVQDKHVLLFLSGGVDSTVTFALLNKALGAERVLGLHIDNGFMRKNESAHIAETYRQYGLSNFITCDASETFLRAVSGLTDPQKKRAAIGETFIAVRNDVSAAQHLNEHDWLLAQGTLYPDIIESGGTKNAQTIKTHHNRVAGIQKLIERGLIVEPLANVYKDEVRVIGKTLGLPDALTMRHPFPGPGLAINVLCSTGVLNSADTAAFAQAKQELGALSLPPFSDMAVQDAYILPVKSVGVQGDFRTYRFPAVLSFAPHRDGCYQQPHQWTEIETASAFITNNMRTVNRTLIRLYQKPGTRLTLQAGYCTRERLDQLRDADDIVLTQLHTSGWYEKIFQHLTISLPYASSPNRTSLVLRPVCSEDVMTARFAQLPHSVLAAITQKIALLPFVDALYFDATNKPPATFGWE